MNPFGAERCEARINFSVLALGDTNYEQFCAAGKKIDARLATLGAKRVHPLVDCDLDYEAKAKGWSESALAALAPSPNGSATPPQKIETEPAAAGWSKTNPFPAKLVTNRKLNGDGSQKETRHFEISMTSCGQFVGQTPSASPAS